MKINNLKNFFSLNILSLLGFMLFSYWVYKTFIQIPQIIKQSHALKSVQLDMLAYAKEMNLMFLLAIFLVIAIILCLSGLVEHFLRKKEIIKTLKFHSKIHNVLFWTGIVLFLIPYIDFLLI